MYIVKLLHCFKLHSSWTFELRQTWGTNVKCSKPHESVKNFIPYQSLPNRRNQLRRDKNCHLRSRQGVDESANFQRKSPQYTKCFVTGVYLEIILFCRKCPLLFVTFVCDVTTSLSHFRNRTVSVFFESALTQSPLLIIS